MTQTVLLGDLIDVVKGISYRSADYSDSENGLAFVTLKSVERGGGYNQGGIKYYAGELKEPQYVEPGDILIANTDLTQNREVIGSPLIMPDIGREACFSLDLSKLVIKDSKKLDKDYLFYYLKSSQARDYMISHSNGSTVMHLSVKSVPKMPISLPGIDDQRKIGKALRNIDEKIELNRKMNETLEQMGQVLFRHHFVDNPEVEKWKVGKFSDVTEVLTGKGSTKSQLSEAGIIPLYGANGIMGTSDKYLHDEPLVITGRVGTLGKVRAITGRAWFSDNVLIMRPKVASFGYVYHLAQTFDYISMNRGSTQPLVTQTDLKNKKVCIPDTRTLDLFEQQFSYLFEQQQNNDQQIKTLISLRDTLLPRLINGKVKIH